MGIFSSNVFPYTSAREQLITSLGSSIISSIYAYRQDALSAIKKKWKRTESFTGQPSTEVYIRLHLFKTGSENRLVTSSGSDEPLPLLLRTNKVSQYGQSHHSESILTPVVLHLRDAMIKQANCVHRSLLGPNATVEFAVVEKSMTRIKPKRHTAPSWATRAARSCRVSPFNESPPPGPI